MKSSTEFSILRTKLENKLRMSGREHPDLLFFFNNLCFSHSLNPCGIFVFFVFVFCHGVQTSFLLLFFWRGVFFSPLRKRSCRRLTVTSSDAGTVVQFFLGSVFPLLWDFYCAQAHKASVPHLNQRTRPWSTILRLGRWGRGPLPVDLRTSLPSQLKD